MSPIRRAGLRALAAAAATTVAVLAFAGSASAHVTVNPREAQQGGYGRLAFRVPTESDTASTTKVEIFLPEDAPVASVSTMPVPGWTVAVERRKLDQPLEAHGAQITEVVSKITWTATGDAAIKPGEFQEFPVSMGPLPDAPTMVFKAIQTYSEGEPVRWIDEAAPGVEADRPAPVLTLTPATDGDAQDAPSAEAAADTDGDSGDGSGLPLTLAIIALVVAVAGLALGGLAVTRARGGTTGSA